MSHGARRGSRKRSTEAKQKDGAGKRLVEDRAAEQVEAEAAERKRTEAGLSRGRRRKLI